MKIGIFAKTFDRKSVDETLAAVRGAGFACTQFNLSCAQLESMPDFVDDAVCKSICEAEKRHDVDIVALSGTFNMAHPDVNVRTNGLARLDVVLSVAARIGIPTVTLCTGSRDADNMWRRHVENDSDDAWRDMRDTMQMALALADKHDVTLAIEPELNNVVNSAAKARRLLDEMRSPRLKIVIDGANLISPGRMDHMQTTLSEGIELLADNIVLAHAKELPPPDHAEPVAIGDGTLDFDHYLNMLRRVGFDGPLIVHGIAEAHAVASFRFLKQRVAPSAG